MPAWEAIIEQYMEGTASRAAAESLRFRIALPADARKEVETVLRLADRLADATQSVRPPAGAAQHLGDRLLLLGRSDVRPNWVQEGGDFVAPQGTPGPGTDEDAVYAAIEGAAIEGTLDPTAPPRRGARAVRFGDAEHDLNAFEQIAASLRRQAQSVAAGSVPAGAIGRLRARLADAQQRGEGGASPIVARRILAQLRGEFVKPPAVARPPDVLAAGEEPEEGDKPAADDGIPDR